MDGVFCTAFTVIRNGKGRIFNMLNEPTVLALWLSAVVGATWAIVFGYLIYLFFKEGGDE